MTKLKITVTKEILKRSKYCGVKGKGLDDLASNCAIALAVRDVFPQAIVGVDRICFGLAEQMSILPKIAQNFINQFDRYGPDARPLIKPISFEIEIPDSVINQINIDELKPLLTNHPTLELVEQN